MTQNEFLMRIAGLLDSAGVPFMVVGSLGSSLHGQPRATNDVDLVIDPTVEQMGRFLDSLGSDFYFSREAALESLQRRSMFNLIDLNHGWKADLIVRKDRPFSREEFDRRTVVTLLDQSLPCATAEDIILSKLEWNRITPSERQLRDALNVASAQRQQLDLPHLRKWASALGVADSLEELLRLADQAAGP